MFWLLRYNEGAVARLLRGRVAALQLWPPPNPGKPILGRLPPYSQLYSWGVKQSDGCCSVSEGTSRLLLPVLINRLNIELVLDCTLSTVILSCLCSSYRINSLSSTLDRIDYWDTSGGIFGTVFNFIAKITLEILASWLVWTVNFHLQGHRIYSCATTNTKKMNFFVIVSSFSQFSHWENEPCKFGLLDQKMGKLSLVAGR